MKRFSLLAAVVVLLAVPTSTVWAQEPGGDMEALSTAAANPLADLMSFPFQNNTNLGIGEFDRTANVLNVQPVIPLAGGGIITRTIFPFTGFRMSRRRAEHFPQASETSCSPPSIPRVRGAPCGA